MKLESNNKNNNDDKNIKTKNVHVSKIRKEVKYVELRRDIYTRK